MEFKQCVAVVVLLSGVVAMAAGPAWAQDPVDLPIFLNQNQPNPSGSDQEKDAPLPEAKTPTVVAPATIESVKPDHQGDAPESLRREMRALRQQYSDDLRKLRDLDLRLKALNGRTKQTVTGQEKGGSDAAAKPVRAPVRVGVDKKKASEIKGISRSVEDLLEVEHPSFDQTLTIESAINYSRYDRTQLTLNGFLALDAIFLGNLAVEGVASDTLTYALTTRYGFNERLVFNLSAPFVYRKTTYAKGGVGGVASANSETDVTRDPTLGDVSLGMSFRLFPTSQAVDWVWNVDITAPTGKHPYGVPVRVVEKDAEGVTTFSVPQTLPTGSGIWSLNTGVSFVKTSDPAILFGNFGIGYNREESFSDVDSDPNTRTAGDINLGDFVSYGFGMAIAMNENTSLSLSFSHKLAAKTKTRAAGGTWVKVIGSDANSAMLNLGITQGLNSHLSVVGTVGAGLTDDAPDFTFGLRFPYRF